MTCSSKVIIGGLQRKTPQSLSKYVGWPGGRGPNMIAEETTRIAFLPQAFLAMCKTL